MISKSRMTLFKWCNSRRLEILHRRPTLHCGDLERTKHWKMRLKALLTHMTLSTCWWHTQNRNTKSSRRKIRNRNHWTTSQCHWPRILLQPTKGQIRTHLDQFLKSQGAWRMSRRILDLLLKRKNLMLSHQTILIQTSSWFGRVRCIQWMALMTLNPWKCLKMWSFGGKNRVIYGASKISQGCIRWKHERQGSPYLGKTAISSRQKLQAPNQEACIETVINKKDNRSRSRIAMSST